MDIKSMPAYKEEWKTYKGVFDQFTIRNLFELESRNVFEEPLSPFKVGKESNVFLAQNDKSRIIVKIYRLENCDFNRMYDYIRKDPRYEYLKKHRREIIFAWTQREYKNLMRAHEFKVSVPKPLHWKYNILVEEMVGRDEPAPPLKDSPPEEPEKFMGLVIEQMQKLYKAGLVHGDLSAFNILNFEEKPYLIDFSQATTIKTPNSEELLMRDVKNICTFFRKQGIKAIPEEIFKKVMAKD